MTRRNFLRTLGLGALGVAAGAYLPKRLYADELVESEKVRKMFSEVYKILVKERGQQFQFEDSIDVNGDGTKDKVNFKLFNGFITMGTDTPSGKRLDVKFYPNPSVEQKIYAIFKDNGEIATYDDSPLCKSYWLRQPEEAEKYLDALIKHYEKK